MHVKLFKYMWIMLGVLRAGDRWDLKLHCPGFKKQCRRKWVRCSTSQSDSIEPLYGLMMKTSPKFHASLSLLPGQCGWAFLKAVGTGGIFFRLAFWRNMAKGKKQYLTRWTHNVLDINNNKQAGPKVAIVALPVSLFSVVGTLVSFFFYFFIYSPISPKIYIHRSTPADDFWVVLMGPSFKTLTDKVLLNRMAHSNGGI